jgi:hypothetical protein
VPPNPVRPATGGRTVSTPLGIIAAFIALSEIVAGAVATQTDDAPQVMFSAFAVGFPLVVLAVFVVLLVKYPLHLYAPKEHESVTSLNAWANALNRQRTSSEALMREAVAEAVTEAVAAVALGREVARDAEPSRIDLSRNVEKALKRVYDAGSVTVHRERIVEDDPQPVQIAVDGETRVQDLLDATYFELAPKVEPYSYGTQWILLHGREVLDGLGQWSLGKPHEGDYRLLQEVDIKPGMHLEAELVVNLP